jgi:hypothetical protein
MSLRINKSVLFRTCSGNDVQSSGGNISITGLFTVARRDLVSIQQIKYRAEVAQVVTLGDDSYTPEAATEYRVQVYDPNRTQAGYTESPKIYKYKTANTLTGTAAQQREVIHLALVAKINADPSNHAVAATLGTGTGFTVTDDGSYYPVYSQNMSNVKGINNVRPLVNSDGSGFAEDAYTLTTAGVYSFGVGAKLLQEEPTVDFVFNNLISGRLTAPPLTVPAAGANPLPAQSGQNYDGFVISSMKLIPVAGVGGQLAYEEVYQIAYADNGTGTSTSNLTGYLAFQRSMLDLIFSTYKDDLATIYYSGATNVTCGGLGTGLPGGTAQDENVVNLGNGFSAHCSPTSNSTVVALISTNDGLALKLDETNGEGVELSAPTWTNSRKQFVVGQSEFSIYTRTTINDVSGLNPFWIGFRKKEAYTATFTGYTDFAVIGLGSATGDIYTNTENDGGGNTATDTTQNWADTETHELEVRVDINGAVTFFIDGYKPTVTQTFSFDSGDALIPVFGYALQTADIGTPSVSQFAAINSNSWRS